MPSGLVMLADAFGGRMKLNAGGTEEYSFRKGGGIPVPVDAEKIRTEY